MVSKHNTFSQFVQPSTLSKLVCTKCKKYLSVFPIYTHATLGSYCGRCPIQNSENLIRDQLYELAVQQQKFPCIYQTSGCLENLFPSQVLLHEKRCPYKKYECPTKVYNNCIWQGLFGDLLEHFESKHLAFILKDSQFEVDFVNNHSENYILPYMDDLFVVTREANSKTNIFSLTVAYIGCNTDVDTYTYMLTLESGNHAYKYTISQDLGKKLEIKRQNVQELLHDPTIIIARIDIKADNSLDNSELADTTTLTNNSNYIDSQITPIDLDQLADLECPVCMDYMVPPIYQCESGHSICELCKDTQAQCPTCRGAFNKTQNYTLEKIVKNLIYPCKHEKCKFSSKAKYIRQHEASCIFGPFKCPLMDYENCNSEMPVSELYDHIAKQHYECLLEFDTISIPLGDNIEEKIEEAYILKHSFRLFKVCFLFDMEDFYWAVQLIGNSEECGKYKFELEIIDHSGKNDRIYLKSTCSPVCDKNTTFGDAVNYVYLEYDQLQKFITEQLTYRVRILTDN